MKYKEEILQLLLINPLTYDGLLRSLRIDARVYKSRSLFHKNLMNLFYGGLVEAKAWFRQADTIVDGKPKPEVEIVFSITTPTDLVRKKNEVNRSNS
jgi:hypothetical protein